MLKAYPLCSIHLANIFLISLSALVSDFSVSGLADTFLISFFVPLAETEFSAAFTENGAQIDPLFEYFSVDLTPFVWSCVD